jgi:hypothetical protein
LKLEGVESMKEVIHDLKILRNCAEREGMLWMVQQLETKIAFLEEQDQEGPL